MAMFLLIASLLSSVKLENKVSPIFLIPGDGGSRLYAKVTRTYQPYFYCSSSEDYYLLWLSASIFIPLANQCYSYNLQLRWIDSRPRNQTGTDIKTGKFGDPESISTLNNDSAFSALTGYFKSIIDDLTKTRLNYMTNQNLFGIPYDFRLGLNDFDYLMAKTKKIIEDNFRGTPVTLLAHSYGCIVTTLFLSKQTADWRKKYVGRFISTSGPYNGSMDTIKAILVGVNFNIHLNEDKIFMETLRTFPSTFVLFPTVGGAVKIKDKSDFTYEEIIQMLQGKNGKAMIEMFKMYKNVLPSLLVPKDVELHCLYSHGVKTPSRFVFSDYGQFPSSPTSEYSDGDGTVGLNSLMECKRRHPWATVKVFGNVGHRDIVKDSRVLSYVEKILNPTTTTTTTSTTTITTTTTSTTTITTTTTSTTITTTTTSTTTTSTITTTASSTSRTTTFTTTTTTTTTVTFKTTSTPLTTMTSTAASSASTTDTTWTHPSTLPSSISTIPSFSSTEKTSTESTPSTTSSSSSSSYIPKTSKTTTHPKRTSFNAFSTQIQSKSSQNKNLYIGISLIVVSVVVMIILVLIVFKKISHGNFTIPNSGTLDTSL